MNLAFLAGWVLATAAWAQARPAAVGPRTPGLGPGWRLDDESVRMAVARGLRGKPVDLEQMRVISPPDFTTRTRQPELEITRIQGTAENGVLFATLRCREVKDCATFLVKVILPHPMRDNSPARTGLRPATSASPDGLFNEGAAGAALVRPRTPARLVTAADGLRITESVWPARAGRRGDIIRVYDRTARRSLLAEVVGPGLLRPAGGMKNQPRGATP